VKNNKEDMASIGLVLKVIAGEMIYLKPVPSARCLEFFYEIWGNFLKPG